MTQEAVMWLTATATTIAVILGAFFAVARILVPLQKRLKFWVTTWEGFMKDWAGEEERPGRDRVPGVMERLNDIDGQLKNNGGTSVKDSVDRIENQLKKGMKRFSELETRIEKIEDKLNK